MTTLPVDQLIDELRHFLSISRMIVLVSEAERRARYCGETAFPSADRCMTSLSIDRLNDHPGP
jgi:hypothetical protein